MPEDTLCKFGQKQLCGYMRYYDWCYYWVTLKENAASQLLSTYDQLMDRTDSALPLKNAKREINV